MRTRRRSPVRGRAAAVFSLVLALTLLGLASSAPARAAGPSIGSITPVSDTNGPILVVTGSGFGTGFPSIGQQTDSPYLQVSDKDVFGWNAGHSGDWCTLTVLSWTDSQVVIEAS